MNSEEFLCIRCARNRKTCCQWSDIYATRGDVARISESTGRQDFTEFRAPSNPAYNDQDGDPAWREHVFRDGSSRRVLRKNPNGDCIFLGKHGCLLPLEVRPLICRLYPFDYTEMGIKIELAEGCPIEFLAPGQSLIELLRMSIDDAHRWHGQLYEEIQMENSD